MNLLPLLLGLMAVLVAALAPIQAGIAIGQKRERQRLARLALEDRLAFEHWILCSQSEHLAELQQQIRKTKK